MNPNYSQEIELMADYSYDESDGDLRVLIKHDYYSSDNDLGKKLLDSFIDNLNLEADRIALVIILDSAVKLLESNSKVIHLIEKSPSTIICSDSLSYYDVNYDSNSLNITLLDSDDIIDTILNSSPNVVIE